MEYSLQKVNKLAAAHASRAMSEMFKEDVKLRIPAARVKKIESLKPMMDPEEMTVGIYLPVSGDVKGSAFLGVPIESAFALCDILLKKVPGTTRKMARMDKAVIKEIGNIVCGQYFTVLSNMLKIKIIEHLPAYSYSTYGAIISEVVSRHTQRSKEALVVEVDIVFKMRVIKIYFLLLLEPLKLTKLIK